jgi:hypothetical protein
MLDDISIPRARTAEPGPEADVRMIFEETGGNEQYTNIFL